jgi:hypothetical protein
MFLTTGEEVETSDLFSLNSSADALIAELSLKQLGWRTFGTLVLLRGMARTVITHIARAENQQKAVLAARAWEELC